MSSLDDKAGYHVSQTPHLQQALSETPRTKAYQIRAFRVIAKRK
jgi:hypothetical protein